MRRILLAALALLLLTMPAHALEPDLTFGAEKLEHALDEETREALSGTSPTSAGDFGKELWHIVSSAISGAGLALRPALVSAGKVLAAAMLCAFASGAQETDAMKLPAQLAGAFAITALCTRDVSSMIGLARETVTKISNFTALLLPVLSSSLAASGGSVSAGTLLAGGSFAMSLLTKLASGVLIPLVYVYILLSAAECATDGGGLGKIRAFGGRAISLLIKGLCAVFTAYLSLSRVLTGSADAFALKAAQAAFSGMVPVVGSMLSDASESLLASAGLIRSAAGAFGILAVVSAVGRFLSGAEARRRDRRRRGHEASRGASVEPRLRHGLHAGHRGERFVDEPRLGGMLFEGGERVMEAIRRYLFSLCAAALLCSLVRALVPKGRMKSICSLLCGVFLAMTALSGLAGWQLTDVAEELTKMRIAAEEARTGVEIGNREALSAIIKSKTEAYIWDKAQELGLSVSVDVAIEEDGAYPYPAAVQISGQFTEMQRQNLARYIEENLAIGKEQQTWTNE